MEEKDNKEPRENQQRQPVDRTPGKAEGDEKTVEEALEKQGNRREKR